MAQVYSLLGQWKFEWNLVLAISESSVCEGIIKHKSMNHSVNKETKIACR